MTPAGRLQGRMAVVTGAGSGIGASVVERFAAEGSTVLAADLNEEAARATAGRARSFGADVHATAVDVRDEDSVRRLIDAALALARLDTLINVAGIGSTTTAPDTPLDQWEDVFAVNARGTFLTCKHAIGPMTQNGGGVIVNIASVAGLVGLRRRAAYCASKGAVIALTRALAVDHVGDGIRVNCISPGTIDSPWVRRLVDESGESLDELRARQPMGRLGSPAEVADAAVYLVAEATFATGTDLIIDGGLTAG